LRQGGRFLQKVTKETKEQIREAGLNRRKQRELSVETWIEIRMRMRDRREH
jgi:hypothetical protein